jgi:hypothetical protein
MPRKSTGKKLRFAVFERDSYTCRYCGSQPPDVVLVVDHLLPVVAEGETDIENLVTACEACNQGKAARVLGAFPPEPDTDMRYLQVAQEANELARFRQALAAKEVVLGGLVMDLQNVWAATAGSDWHPAEHVVRPMLGRYSPESVEEAFRDVSHKVGSGYVEKTRWVQYTWAVLRNIEAESAG